MALQATFRKQPFDFGNLFAQLRAKKSTTVQTVICFKSRFKTLADAKKWVKEHKFKTTWKGRPPVEKETSWHFRQRDPADFIKDSFRTIKLATGVSAIIGKLKEGK